MAGSGDGFPLDEEVDEDMESANKGSSVHAGTEEADEDESSSVEEDADLSTEFHIDKSMHAVEYGSVEEILEVYQSLNIARITPEGYLAQNAKAYACAVKKRGSTWVYIGLHLTEKDEVLIYSSRKRSRAGSFRRIMQNAIDFLETAGFLMDPLSLGNDSKSRVKVIGKIPILSQAH
jgi:hypothetical protein